MLGLHACQIPGISNPNAPPISTLATGTPVEKIMTPSTPESTSDVINPMAKVCVADLAKRLAINTEQIKILEVTAVLWRDASLGCPKPGIDYIRVETPGYRISLEADGKVYTYHTDESRRAIQCNKP